MSSSSIQLTENSRLEIADGIFVLNEKDGSATQVTAVHAWRADAPEKGRLGKKSVRPKVVFDLILASAPDDPHLGLQPGQTQTQSAIRIVGKPTRNTSSLPRTELRPGDAKHTYIDTELTEEDAENLLEAATERGLWRPREIVAAEDVPPFEVDWSRPPPLTLGVPVAAAILVTPLMGPIPILAATTMIVFRLLVRSRALKLTGYGWQLRYGPWGGARIFRRSASLNGEQLFRQFHFAKGEKRFAALGVDDPTAFAPLRRTLLCIEPAAPEADEVAGTYAHLASLLAKSLARIDEPEPTKPFAEREASATKIAAHMVELAVFVLTITMGVFLLNPSGVTRTFGFPGSYSAPLQALSIAPEGTEPQDARLDSSPDGVWLVAAQRQAIAVWKNGDLVCSSRITDVKKDHRDFRLLPASPQPIIIIGSGLTLDLETCEAVDRNMGRKQHRCVDGEGTFRRFDGDGEITHVREVGKQDLKAPSIPSRYSSTSQLAPDCSLAIMPTRFLRKSEGSNDQSDAEDRSKYSVLGLSDGGFGGNEPSYSVLGEISAPGGGILIPTDDGYVFGDFFWGILSVPLDGYANKLTKVTISTGKDAASKTLLDLRVSGKVVHWVESDSATGNAILPFEPGSCVMHRRSDEPAGTRFCPGPQVDVSGAHINTRVGKLYLLGSDHLVYTYEL